MAKAKKKKLVTRDSLQALLDNPNQTHRMHVIGRALTVLFNRQTLDEQRCEDTIESNGIGFTGADGFNGARNAKWYIEHKHLDPFFINKWFIKSQKTGFSRITKYHKQLNEHATEQAKLKGAETYLNDMNRIGRVKANAYSRAKDGE